MAIFLKHIFRTVKKAPLQPILILLTMILSVAVGVTAFRFGNVFFVRSNEINKEESSLGDISVTASAERPNGILFDSDAKELLGDRARVLGDFSLVAFSDGENGMKQPVLASALDLFEADRFFLFDYYSYGNFDEVNIDRSVIISKAFADKRGLIVGDILKIEILNEEMEYTVEAIAENSGILYEKEVLLPIESIVRLLAERSAFVSSLGDSFAPYNRLMIKCADGEDIDEIAKLLSESAAMGGCRVDNLSKTAHRGGFAQFESVAILIIGSLISGLAVLLIMTAQSLMQKQRASEYALFCAAGASRGQLASLQYGESFIYAAVGAIGGVLISPYTLEYVIALFSWQSYGVAVGIEGVVFGILLSFLLSFIGTFITVSRDKRRELALMLSEEIYPKATREGYGSVIGVGAFLMLSVAVILICPVKYRYIPVIPAIISFIVLLYVSAGHILKGIATLLERSALRTRSGGGVGILAFKSMKNNRSLRHCGRLLCVLSSLMCAIFICSSALTKQYVSFDNIIAGDMLAINMNAEKAEEIRNDESVEGVSTFYYSDAVVLNGKHEVMTIFTSGDSKECLSDEFTPERMPEDGEIVMSGTVARLAGVKLGDEISMDVNGKIYTVKVTEICDFKIPIVYLSCSYIPTNLKMNCIKLNDGIEIGDEAYGEVVADILSSGAQVVDKKEVTGTIINTLDGFTGLVKVVVIVALVISLAGCANLFTDSLMSRKREREILFLCGIEKERIVLMHLIEVLVAIMAALIIGVICGITISLGLNVYLNSFGFSLLL